jgi:hypothetical protein
MFDVLGELLDVVRVHYTCDASTDREHSDLARRGRIENDIRNLVSGVSRHAVRSVAICAIVEQRIEVGNHLGQRRVSVPADNGGRLSTEEKKFLEIEGRQEEGESTGGA